MRLTTFVLAAVSYVSLATPAAAIEPLTANELRDVCAVAARPESAETRLCVFYVKGFLDGAVATDARVAENVVDEIQAEETFAERAIRTRVIDRLRDFGPSFYAEFCVGQPDPIVDVVQHVVQELERYDDLDGVYAQTVVYAALRRHYPCVAE